MYIALLFLHSWLRWLALPAVVIVFARAVRGAATNAPWTSSDSTAMKAAAYILTAQVGVGVLLYAVSPFIRSLFDDMGATMRDPGSRFFVIEHATAMILALGAVHMGSAFVRRGATDKARHTRAAIFFGIAMLLIGYAIPWMRPAFRISL